MHAEGCATGGQSSTGSAAGNAAAGGIPASSSASAWAERMKRGQAMSHGASAAAHAVRSGDHGGGSLSVSLDQDDRR